MGQPARLRMLERLIQHILGKKHVWIARPIDIAEYWMTQGY